MIRKNITLAGLTIVLAISLSGCSLISGNQQTSRPVVPNNTNNNNAQVSGNQNSVVTPPVTEPPVVNQEQVSPVSISGFAFSPQNITIPAGATVTWTNSDVPPHTVKFADFVSPTLATGQTYQHKFDTPGIYEYSCGIHPSMKGTVIVE